jgi:hypothetical protein
MAKESFCLMAAMSIVQFPPHIGHLVLSGRILSTFRSKLSVLAAVRSSFSEYCGRAQHPRQISDGSELLTRQGAGAETGRAALTLPPMVTVEPHARLQLLLPNWSVEEQPGVMPR